MICGIEGGLYEAKGEGCYNKRKGGSIMYDYGFTLKQLFWENMGNEPFYLRNFWDSIEYLDEPFSNITLQVIRLLLGNMQACDTLCHENSRIEARVQIGQAEYTVTVMFQDRIAMFYVIDEDGKDCTVWYLQTVTHSLEEQELSCFLAPGVYPVRLHQYKDPAQRYPGNLRKATRTIGNTRTFRDYLRHFIQDFQPQRLLPDKDYWLRLEMDGRFVVCAGINGEKLTRLNETENWIYHYLCFLHLLRFWDGMQELRNYKDVKLPVLMNDFSKHLKESADRNFLFSQAKDLARQVLIFV